MNESEDQIVFLGITCPCGGRAVQQVLDSMGEGLIGNALRTERSFLEHEFMCRFCGGKAEVLWREVTPEGG